MRRFNKIFKATVIAILLIVIGVPATFYVVLSTPWAQKQLCTLAQVQLSNLLGTEVSIGKVQLGLFDSMTLADVKIQDDYGVEALQMKTLSARFETLWFLQTGQLNIDYVSIDHMNARLYKKTAQGPLNIQGIIDHLKPKDKNKPPSKINLMLQAVEITNSSFAFNILDAPQTGKFNPQNLNFDKVNLYAVANHITERGADITLKSLSFEEACGLKVTNLQAGVRIFPGDVALTGFLLQMPSSHIAVADMHFAPKELSELARIGVSLPFNLQILKGSYLTPSDMAAFVPALSKVNERFDVALQLEGNFDSLCLDHVEVKNPEMQMLLNAQGRVLSLNNTDSLRVPDLMVELKIDAGKTSHLLGELIPRLSPRVKETVHRLSLVNVALNGQGSLSDFNGSANIKSMLGNVGFDGLINIADPSAIKLQAEMAIDGLNLCTLLNNPDFGSLTASIQAYGIARKQGFAGQLDFLAEQFQFRGVDYRDVALQAVLNDDKTFSVELESPNPSATLSLFADGSYGKTSPAVNFLINVDEFNPAALNLGHTTFAQNTYSFACEGGFVVGRNLWPVGRVNLKNLVIQPLAHDKQPLRISDFSISSHQSKNNQDIEIASSFFNGQLEGNFNLASFVPGFQGMLHDVFPEIISKPTVPLAHTLSPNNLNYTFNIENADEISQFFNLPVRLIYPVTIEGAVDQQNRTSHLTLDAPYLLQGTKLIENTALQASIEGDYASVYATLQMPTKKGNMALVALLEGAQNRIDTRVDWHLERLKPINGSFSISTLLGRDDDKRLTAQFNLNPSDINFGTDTWHINAATIDYSYHNVTVNNFAMATPTQRISINGTASSLPESLLQVDLENIELLSIFQTLDIDKALIGGKASGTLTAQALFSPNPVLQTQRLDVDSISYNGCVLGCAQVKANFDTETQNVNIDADVTNPQGQLTRIYGTITPAAEELDINFDANHVRVGFLKPFMSAFAADVSGLASGHARLFGNFKYIDLEGDIVAHDFGLKIAFTNTWYHCSDTIHIRPGIIDIPDVTVYDVYGNTAKLSGKVKHKFFKEPKFDFALTQAKNFLSYDITPKLNPDWYGKIFGNGSAFINGYPGVVNIDVNMSTAPNSTFTFVLTDRLDAEAYSFITFRDRTERPTPDSIIAASRIPEIVRQLQSQAIKNADVPSEYNMSFQMEITPDAKLVIVMDPEGGDEIKAVGNGNLRMTYQAPSNDLRMYGQYTIDRGSYNFTLQDIIVKDFSIRAGSSITFTGDPYSARLAITAAYGVNANLSDLDESFLQDKDLNRTNVPVNALLQVNGDMRQPEISFDLEFPTLTSDTYRKVRSIISTDEMMNRQIIYLLALSRFYTPEYMSTTKGNELFSVASSTIGSQLSSMLGKLSENWTIAPQLRSDKGDLSDVQFDVALSSTLLNNRLRLNGNFGYRDKSLNTNQFVGDFDIEYLLNPSGSWRLRAYNRYNDQNYYLRTAQTTQGLGIMYKRDFDNMFQFLRRKAKQAPQPDNIKSDTTKSDTTKTRIPDILQSNSATTPATAQ